MKNLKFLALTAFAFAMISCGGDKKTDTVPTADTATTEAPTADATAPAAADAGSYDPKRGMGKWDASNVDVSKFDAAMADAGKKAAEVKCFSCHKLTDEKLVGPGWKGISSKHEPFWIMNFITNPDPMIDVDPELQKQLEICLVRMPNQGLTDDDARKILEFMRKNDGVN